jgi:hypothetical protein
LGGELVDIIQRNYPGGFSAKSNISLRWGQDTDLPPDRTTVIFDLGYFLREKKNRGRMHYRVSINELHPTRLPEASPERWDSLRIKLENLHDPDGHILLVGRGRKTRRKDGSYSPLWESEQIDKIKLRFPDRKIIYRPKKMPDEKLRGAVTDGTSSIRDLCRGCAVVVSHSSNVANEAILYGIPAVAVGGPASDVCSAELPAKHLGEAIRLDYLRRLAWWQWSVDEIRSGAIWPWLMNQIELRR